jgi:hypothetical protein
MFTQIFYLAIGLAILFVPGVVVLSTFGIRARLLFAGLAAPLTVGLLLLAAMVTAAAGIPFNLLSFSVFVVLVAVASAVARRLLTRRRSSASAAGSTVELKLADRDQRALLTGGNLLSARVLGWLTGIGGIVIGWWTWKRGLGAWSTPTQEHDPITHSVITAYIKYSGNAAPWELRPLDVTDGEAIVYYPSGLPRLAALIADAMGDPMTALNLATVAILTVAWPLSVAALAAAMVRVSGLGKGWTELGGGIAILVAACLYRPAISFAHDGGILPNAAAIVMVPGLIAAMLVLGRRQWALVLPLGVSCAGMLSLHSSAAFSTALTLLAAWVGLLLTESGRARLRASVLPVLAVAVVALVFCIPILAELLGIGGGVSAAPPTIEPTPLETALHTTFGLSYLGYFDPTGQMSQLVVGVLAIAGLLAMVVLRRGWPIITAYLFWVAVILSFQVSPNSGFGAKVAGFYYNVFNRVQSHVDMLVPVMVAGLCVFCAAAFVAVRWSRLWPGATWLARPAVAIGGLALLLVVLLFTSLLDYARTNATALAERYEDPQFRRYDDADRAAMEWLDGRVQPGQTILNNANDGSTLAYVRYQLPIMNVTSTGSTRTPDAIKLLAHFDDYPSMPEVRSILIEHNVSWIYVDSHAPMIGAVPTAWHHQSRYTVAPGLADLDDLPGLREVFTADHVSVYRLDLSVVRAL